MSNREEEILTKRIWWRYVGLVDMVREALFKSS